jgi:hypothetical protein
MMRRKVVVGIVLACLISGLIPIPVATEEDTYKSMSLHFPDSSELKIYPQIGTLRKAMVTEIRSNEYKYGFEDYNDYDWNDIVIRVKILEEDTDPVIFRVYLDEVNTMGVRELQIFLEAASEVAQVTLEYDDETVNTYEMPSEGLTLSLYRNLHGEGRRPNRYADVSVYKTVEEQNAPQAIRVFPSSSTVPLTAGEQQTFKIKATDEDGDLNMVQWEVNGKLQKTDSLATLNEPDFEGSADFSYSFEDDSIVEAIVYDNKMNEDRVTWNVWMGEAPTIISFTEIIKPGVFFEGTFNQYNYGRYPMIMEITAVDGLEFKGILHWPKLGDSKTKFRGKIDSSLNQIWFTEYEQIQGSSIIVLNGDYYAEIEDNSLSGYWNWPSGAKGGVFSIALTSTPTPKPADIRTYYINLNPIANVGVGEPLMITGETNREDGTAIVVEVRGPVHLPVQIVEVKDGTFKAVFDTTEACVGMYTVKADDEEGGIDEAEVEIGFAVPPTTKALEVEFCIPPSNIPFDGSTTFAVMVTSNGNPVEGAHVDFSTDKWDKWDFTSFNGDTTKTNGILVAEWTPSYISQESKNVGVTITAEASKVGYDSGSATATILVNPTEEPYITETSATESIYKQGGPITLTVKVKKGGEAIAGLSAGAFHVCEGGDEITGRLGEHNDFKEVGGGDYEIVIREENCLTTTWPLKGAHYPDDGGYHYLYATVHGQPDKTPKFDYMALIYVEAVPKESEGPLEVYIDCPSRVDPGEEFKMTVKIVNPTDDTFAVFEKYDIIIEPEGFVIKPGGESYFKLGMTLPEALANVVGDCASVVPRVVRVGSTLFFIEYLKSQGVKNGMPMPPKSAFYCDLYATAPEKTGSHRMSAKLDYHYITYHGTGLQRWLESSYNTMQNENPDKGEAYSEEKRIMVGEVPERISKLSYIVFKLRSAADLHIYDPEGRHVGHNTETGEVEIGIPDATYTESPIEIKVPNLEAGGYKAVLIGTEAGEYELDVIAKTGNKTLAEASYEGWITEGATQEMVTTISSIVGPLDVRLGTLEAVVEAEDSYSEQFSLDAGDELEIDAIDETGVLLRIEAEEDCEGEVKISDYSENPTIKGFPGEYKYYALEKYVGISLDVDKEKIDGPIYLEVHYDKDELPENVDESTLTMYHYWNDTKWRSCYDFEMNPEENCISVELEKDELSYYGIGGLYAPIWVRYSVILALMAIMIVLAVGYFPVRRFVKSRKVKAMKVPERVPAKVAITIYNFDNSFRLLKEREETAKIFDGLDGRLASGEIKEETYNDLKSKYESKKGDLNSKIKSELERAKAYLQRIEDERYEMLKTQENLNEKLLKEGGRKKREEISTKIGEISDEIERVEGVIKIMKEKVDSIERGFF